MGKGWVKFGRKNEETLTKRRRRVELKKRRLAGEDVNESDEGDNEDDNKMEEDAVHEDNEDDDKMKEDASHDDNDDVGRNLTTDERVAESAGEKEVPDTSHDHDLALYLQAMVDDGDDADSDNGSEEGGSDGGRDGNAESSEHGSEAERSDNDDSDESSSQTGSVDSYEEKNSYDPEKLKRKDLAWLDRGHVLGFNPEAPAMHATLRLNQTNFRRIHFTKDVYKCWQSASGLNKEDEIDRDVLYTLFAQNNLDYARVLSLDYGQMDGPEQVWTSVQGEEYVVSDPGYKEDFPEVIQNLVHKKLFIKNAGSLDLACKVQSDPLRALPYDVLYEIFTHLSFKDSTSLMQSSWHVFASTRHGSFWKQMLRLHLLPWFWEASAIVSGSSTTEGLDAKDLFLWIEAATRPRFGIEGPLMSIANRRRIWNVCQQLAPQYAEEVQPVGQAEPDDAEAQAILDRAKCFHMPVVVYPIPKEIRTVSTQFIRSWSEVSYRSSVLDTYWGPKGTLVGISITFSGTSPRIFGSAEGTLGNPMRIPPNAWIREINVCIDDVNMFSRVPDRDHVKTALDNKPYGVACIRSLTVTLTDKTTKCVRTPDRPTSNRRPVIVLSGLNLVGLTGQVAESGEICRLGLLQASIPGEEPAKSPSYSEAQQLLWNKSAQTLYCDCENGWNNIWTHPSLKIRSIGAQGSSTGQLRSFTGDITSDMTPWHVGIWAPDASQKSLLKRISCFQPTGGMASNGKETWAIPHIVGFAVDNTSGNRRLLAGSGGPEPVQCPDWQEMTNPRRNLVVWIQGTTLKSFDEKSMEHFLIDGPGGEIVTEVHASGDMKAIKLFTNRGRDCYFGEKYRQDWDWLEYRVEPGHMIVGLVCAFGRLGGWSGAAKMYSHWMLSGLGVLIVADDYKKVD
ncbi:uncharacterized protein N0V89_006549 [Didymosphaeria variabile]|uniref:F-box domain-containing protein n=1 Tax=Didymosphaeria variabile TaxID=1932322 RepID=A0A9W8XHA5_9PLEO|nr:uncharacterized protein N0V89_006549 [Didymosphaeria variabile]KAJ4351210.1 hypothetical protein N0V89_006549 [Didymosphaeria variabile]